MSELQEPLSVLLLDRPVGETSALETILHWDNVSVVRANSFSDAYRFLRCREFDGIVVDLRLGEDSSGSQALRQLSQLYLGCPVIALVEPEGLQMACSTVYQIRRPLKIDSITKQIRNAIACFRSKHSNVFRAA